MKFIKLFESYKITGLDNTTVISAINSLRYIIEDEGYGLSIDTKPFDYIIGFGMLPSRNKYCIIRILKNFIEGDETYEINRFMRSDSYLEFLDRLSESLKDQFYLESSLGTNDRYIKIDVIEKRYK